MPPRQKSQRPPRNRRLSIETSGIPRRPDSSDELGKQIAMRLGIIPRPIRPEQPRPQQFIEAPLSNPELPIHEYLDEIVGLVDDNPVTICVAETGSGKTTQIGKELMRHGYRVTVTQPRRIAAEMVSARIIEEVADVLGYSAANMLVGFQTAERRTITQDTRLGIVTDGLRTVQELGVFDQDTYGDEPQVLIIDEVHERNKNIDVLIAWTQKLVAEGSNLRVVFTTASINADRLARHYQKVGVRPPIIEVPGRSFGIETHERPESTVAEEVARYAREGKNVLAFLPGLTEIEDAMSATKRILGSDVRGFDFQRLHGKLSPQEQGRVQGEAQGVRLVFATNVAETSITIPDVDVIVDSGLERRVEIDDKEGIESLQVGVISQASCLQRAGRCGRTKPGTYVSTRLNRRVGYKPIIEREAYGKPEILRTNVDRTVLAIACTGLDITQLDMLDKIAQDVLLRSKRALQTLGALDDHYKVTERGRRMNEFPIRPSLSRMIVYGIENNFSEEVRAQLAAIAAAIESGGLPDYTRDSGDTWKKLVHDKTSDLLGQLDIFIATQGMNRRDLADNDLNQRAVTRAHELYNKLLRRSKIKPGKELQAPSQEQKQQILDAIVAGMIDFVYVKKGSEYVRTTSLMGKLATHRAIGDRSTVTKRGADTVVGVPYALAPPPDRPDLPEKHIIQEITRTSPDQLARVALELCDWEGERLQWRDGVPYVVQTMTFRDAIDTGLTREKRADWSVPLARELIDMALRQPGQNLRRILDLKKETEHLWNLSGTSTRIKQERIEEILKAVTGLTKKSMQNKPMTVSELDRAIGAHLALFQEQMPSYEEQSAIRAASPELIEYHGVLLPLAYRGGVPYISRITDEIKKDLRTTTGPLRLTDGRDILVPHTVNGRSRRYTVEQFRERYV